MSRSVQEVLRRCPGGASISSQIIVQVPVLALALSNEAVLLAGEGTTELLTPDVFLRFSNKTAYPLCEHTLQEVRTYTKIDATSATM